MCTAGLQEKAGKALKETRRSRVLRQESLLVIGLALGLLTSCGGGGGSSGDSLTTVSSPPAPTTPTAPLGPPPTGPSTPSGPSEAEIAENYGLGAINAPAAYSAGATGSGVTVAIIDSGIDVDHPEFLGRIHPQSTDIVANSPGSLDDTNGHGTHVAGIVGAAADSSGVVGVSPDAQILAIRANARGADVSGDELLYFDEVVADAIHHAVDNDADLINLSLGKLDSISNEYRAALERAIANDVLIVASAGNEPSGETTRPASFAGSGLANGRILAVGAVDSDEQIASFSGQPGFTELNEAFLVAPGVDIRSTDAGGGLGTRSGTSFSTPHVTGAAAVLRSAFPSLTMAQIADLLIDTAKDLGDPGPDPVYGQGLIDIEAALAPQGVLSIAADNTVDGDQASITDTELSLGAAFGDALATSTALEQVMALDAYDRPYAVDLSDQVVRPETSFYLDSLLIDGPNQHATALPGSLAGGSTSLAWRAEEVRLWDRGATGFRADTEAPTELNRFDFSGSDEAMSWRVGYGLGASTLLTSGPAQSSSEGLFWRSQTLSAPESELIGLGTGGATRHLLGERTELVLGIMQSGGMEDLEREREQDDELGDAQMFHIGLDHRATDRLRVGLGFSQVEEDEAFLGSSGDGAFGEDAAASTRMMTLRGDLDLGAGFNLFATGTMAQTAIGGDQGMLGEWSTVQSQAFSLGLTRTGVLGTTDRIGLMVGQPLRVSDASATLDMPATRDLDGNVERRRERVDMAPEGREIDLQLSYKTPLGERFQLGSWFMFRHEPGHDAEAEDDYAIGLRLDRQF